jgi:hypothetical protein
MTQMIFNNDDVYDSSRLSQQATGSGLQCSSPRSVAVLLSGLGTGFLLSLTDVCMAASRFWDVTMDMATSQMTGVTHYPYGATWPVFAGSAIAGLVGSGGVIAYVSAAKKLCADNKENITELPHLVVTQLRVASHSVVQRTGNAVRSLIASRPDTPILSAKTVPGGTD